MNFAQISKELRKQNNISQEKLAKEIGVSKACISMIEIGKNEPTANTLCAYANYFKCSTDYLLEREDDFGIEEKSNIDNSYTYDERQLIDIYRRLPEDRKKSMINFANDNFQLATGESYNQFLKFKKA